MTVDDWLGMALFILVLIGFQLRENRVRKEFWEKQEARDAYFRLTGEHLDTHK